MRLTRGASLKGAAGIRWRRGAIIRPMLSFLRADTERFLGEMGVGFATDPMNSDRQLFRTRIRRDVLPALAGAAGPGAIQNLARFSRLAAEDSSVLEELARLAYQRLLIGPDVLDAPGVRCLEPPLRRRVLGRLVRQTGGSLDWECIDRAMEALEEGTATPLPKGWSLRCEGGAIRLVPRHPARAVLPSVQLREEWTEDPGFGVRLRLSRKPPLPPAVGIRVLQPALPLIARQRRRGDRVPSRGGRPGRKVQDLLVDSGVQAELRDIIPIVCDARGKILWVVGVWPRPSSSEADDDANTTCANDSWYLLAEPTSESAQRFGLRYKLPSVVRG
jgi:tRNA(Ile)-lysidine synthase